MRDPDDSFPASDDYVMRTEFDGIPTVPARKPEQPSYDPQYGSEPRKGKSRASGKSPDRPDESAGATGFFGGIKRLFKREEPVSDVKSARRSTSPETAPRFEDDQDVNVTDIGQGFVRSSRPIDFGPSPNLASPDRIGGSSTPSEDSDDIDILSGDSSDWLPRATPDAGKEAAGCKDKPSANSIAWDEPDSSFEGYAGVQASRQATSPNKFADPEWEESGQVLIPDLPSNYAPTDQTSARQRNVRDFDSDDSGRTIAPSRHASPGISSLGANRSKAFRVEFYDEDSTKWQLLARVEDDGLNLGRSSFRNLISKACEMTIAESHARIDVENEEIRVTPLKSRNGLYKKLPKGLKHELSDGDRFRLWRVVLEFRSCAAAHGQGLVLNASESDEIPINKVPEPIGFLHVIGKDDKPQITFPLMKTEIHQVSLGRKDGIVFHYPEISRSHARIEFKNDRVYLVDCGSRNGTFVRIDHPTKLKSAQLSDSRSMESLVEEVILGDIRIRVIWTTIKD